MVPCNDFGRVEKTAALEHCIMRVTAFLRICIGWYNVPWKSTGLENTQRFILEISFRK